MFVTVYDPQRLISLSIHAGGSLTQQELDNIVRHIRKLGVDGIARGKPTTVLVLVETENTLDASQRKRIADATQAIHSGYQAFVTSSRFTRLVMTAYEWLRPSKGDFHQSVHASYGDARAWLVKRTKHSPELFDLLHAEVREGLRKALAAAKPDRSEI